MKIPPVTIPPGAAPRTSTGPGMGNCLKQSGPGDTGAGRMESNFSFFLWSSPFLALSSVENFAYFPKKKSLEFVTDQQGKNNL